MHLYQQVIHRYVLPFKKMLVPPAADNLYKYRKGAQRLSDWITGGSSDGTAIGLAPGIITMQHPALAQSPPLQEQRVARANLAWGRGRLAQQRRSRLRSIVGDDEASQETRQVVDAVMNASGAYSTDSDNDMAVELERLLEEGEDSGDARPSQGGDVTSLQEVSRMLMEDSDDEDEHQEEGERGSGDGPSASVGGDELSEYEKERATPTSTSYVAGLEGMTLQ